MASILQVNYQLSGSVTEFLRESGPLADVLAATPGLCWKVWLTNESLQEGGGVYLFEDAASRDAFADGPVIARLKAHPAVRTLSVKRFGVAEQPTRTTRGPIPGGAA